LGYHGGPRRAAKRRLCQIVAADRNKVFSRLLIGGRKHPERAAGRPVIETERGVRWGWGPEKLKCRTDGGDMGGSRGKIVVT
jgi:hypothetical protein